MRVYLKKLQGITTVAKSDSNHWITMDGSEKFGGSRAASTPKELVLISLAGCSSADVISIIDKMRLNYNDYQVVVSAQESEEHPRVFTKIHIDYYFFGDEVKEESVKRAIELSMEKYCSVAGMLKKTVEITTGFFINKPVPAEK